MSKGGDVSILPSFYERLESEAVAVDAAMAASMVSGFRANNGLGAVAVDANLNAIAQAQADAMARADRVSHSLDGRFSSRLLRAGYEADIAVENIGAGYRTLAEAFSGWRDSPEHRANMLRDGVTRMGIATAYTPGSKYKVFWSMVLAKPSEPRDQRREGPNAGPRVDVTIGGAPLPR
jgi:uncharacterized protein YkwD